MTLQELTLYQFRNYDHLKLQFNERVVGFCGPNGVGKTNLLDAIHYLCLTKTYFGRSDAGNVKFGLQGFRIEGNGRVDSTPFQVVCILRENGKKEMHLNHEPYVRFSEHIGRFPIVVVAPDDVVLVTGGSEERRTLLDTIISQFDQAYLQQLIAYNRILLQRNSLLRQFADIGRPDLSLLQVMDEQLSGPAQHIYEKRKRFVETYIPEVQQMYQMISGSKEDIQLRYDSPLHLKSMPDLLHDSFEKDRYAQRTTTGIHRDDLDFVLDTLPFRQVASQGQRKSLLFALKLAEFQVLKNHKGFSPFLLLDDVFEKLDAERMNNLLQWACLRNEGQVFLTDTHQERLREALASLSVAVQLIPLGE
ncbi:MAG: DNA replication/repair protein RecF [Sphingobacteriales bacterium]